MKNDGGPAFPRPASPGAKHANESQAGMSLRDYFAGRAIPAAWLEETEGWEKTGHAPSIAKLAYELADAMIVAREKPEPAE